MAHFAKLDENNVVTNVIVIGNAVPTSNGPLGENDMHPDGEAYCTKLLGGKWKQTSYNNRFRKQYAGKGYTYDSVNDVFITPKPYPSWTLNSNFDWQPPVAMPLGKYRHYKTGEELNYNNVTCNWEEDNQRWVCQTNDNPPVSLDLLPFNRIDWDEDNQRWVAYTHDEPSLSYVWNPDTSTYTAL